MAVTDMTSVIRVSVSSTFRDLGVRQTKTGGEIRVFSAHAEGIDMLLYDSVDPNHVAHRVPLQKSRKNIWSARSEHLRVGAEYALQAWGPSGVADSFSPEALLIDPYARGLTRFAGTQWRNVVIDTAFDWGTTEKPQIDLDKSVIYEAHVRGLTKQNPNIPLELRGTYAGLAHPAMTSYLKDLGITAVELLPIHAFISEQHLLNNGTVNYWGYNTLNFFTPHAEYATHAARVDGPGAVLREVKQMVRDLHEAGLEVILDVVFNHTAEEGQMGPKLSFRGLDNATYYRHDADGNYIDTTGCGNTLNAAEPVVQQLIIDSLHYWADEVRVDGFRFDLAVTLGRDADGVYRKDHPLLEAIRSDPALAGVKMIAEPWDLGHDGWQTGNFESGWAEWNDRYRDRVRNFWLPDIAQAREKGVAPTGVGGFATRLAGSSNTFSGERGPIASVNFITAHDGFTLADLTTYNTKHNIGNGEDNRDGANDNRSFNHGAEGPTDDVSIATARRRTMRNLMGTLLLSGGIPMMTAGDEFGRTQHGNNNAYCHDSPLTWVNWELQPWQEDLLATTKHLTRMRRENPALRPIRFGIFGERVPSASQVDWYNAHGRTMTSEEWDDPHNRTLQYVVASTPQSEAFDRILMVVHGTEQATDIILPEHPEVKFYEPLWLSSHAAPRDIPGVLRPGEKFTVPGMTIMLFNAE
ncbi:glycogen debranching protein GlgX [Alpinimonas psychrophila]